MKKLLLIPLFAFTTAFLCDSGDVKEDDPFVGSPADTAEVVPTPAQPEPRFNDPEKKGKGLEKATVAETPEGFCHPGMACDITGERGLALMVSPANSTFQIKTLKVYYPDDDVAFILCAKDVDRKPIPGLPAIVRVKQTARLLAGDGLTLTGADGCATATGVVQLEDLHDGPGSYIVNAYIGGRLLNQIRILPDSLF